jgi:DNA-binding MarR family transcriptional regulator
MDARNKRGALAKADAPEKVDRYHVGLSLKRAQHELRLAINADLAVLETNISQVNVLREVMLNPGVSSVELARLAFLTPQSLGQLVAQMQNRGLVERRPGDGRKLRHYLTASGEQLCRQAMDRVRDLDATMLEGFTDDELLQLIDVFHTLEKRATAAREHTKRLVVVNSNRKFV